LTKRKFEIKKSGAGLMRRQPTEQVARKYVATKAANVATKAANTGRPALIVRPASSVVIKPLTD